MHSTMFAGSKFFLHSAGWLDDVLCTGFEKLVMDAVRLGSYHMIISLNRRKYSFLAIKVELNGRKET